MTLPATTPAEFDSFLRAQAEGLRPFNPKSLHASLGGEQAPPALRRAVPQNATYVETGADIHGPVDHRPRSDLPGASNTGVDMLTGATRWSNSRNWSGAVIGARGGRRFDIVSATWTLPAAVTVPAGETLPPGDGYRLSIWIGLDGHRMGSPSMPQIGTTLALCRDPASGEPTLTAYAWTQWWVRGKGGEDGYTEVRIRTFDLVPGDTVTCGLFLSDRDDVNFSIRRHRGNKLTGLSWVSHRLLRQDVILPRPGEAVAGSGACFIVERPMKHRSTAMYPLPDFGAVAFRECWARTLPIGGTVPAERRIRDLRAARRIRMVDLIGGPARIKTLARPVQPRASDPPDSLRIEFGRERA